MLMMKVCVIYECENKQRSSKQGWCEKHYRRWYAHGDPLFSAYSNVWKTPTYRSWGNMIKRCEQPKATGYKYWGGRGIKVCERWRNSFQNFLDDMGERPEGLSLDRIDSNGNYEPGNCRWATISQQNSNKRHRITA
jgi:hypothetical protein